ncbi:MAG: hypothetical protein R2800_06615 [Flavipsychrobacter sp.]
MSNSNFFLLRLTLPTLLVLLSAPVIAQHHDDLPTPKNSESFALKGVAKEMTEQYYSIAISGSTDTLTKNDTTYTLIEENKMQFDSLGHLTQERNLTYNNRGKVNHSNHTDYQYTSTGKIYTIEHYINEHLVSIKRLHYNNDNLLSELVQQDKKGKLESTTLFYYKDGQVFNIKIKDEDNVMQNFIRLSYDSKDQLKEREYRGATMQLLNSQKYLRDTLNDTITRLNLYDYATDGKVRALFTYLYDQDGNIIQQTILDSNKKTTLYQTNTYNEQNELTKETNFSNDIKTENSYQYTHDQQKSWITQTISQQGVLMALRKRAIVYYTKED